MGAHGTKERVPGDRGVTSPSRMRFASLKRGEWRPSARLIIVHGDLVTHTRTVGVGVFTRIYKHGDKFARVKLHRDAVT